MLRLALLVGTDADIKGATYKSACHTASRLQPLFNQDVEPEAVLGFIEAAGGLRRLYGDEEDSDEGQCQSDRNDAEEDEPEAAPSGKGSSQKVTLAIPPHRLAPPERQPHSQPGQARARQGRSVVGSDCVNDDFDPLATGDDEEVIILEVAITRAMLRELSNTPVGSRSRLIVEHAESSPKWEHFKATAVKAIA